MHGLVCDSSSGLYHVHTSSPALFCIEIALEFFKTSFLLTVTVNVTLFVLHC
jgi:hypothetical protein